MKDHTLHKIFFLTFIAVFIFLPAFSIEGLSRQAFAESSNREELDAISAEEFIQSDASRLFQEEKYEEAIQALDGLLKKYPKDPLLVRYKAISLDRLGKSDEAIALFQDLLLDTPDHIPAHYFLGQAYARKGDSAKASEEWKWVSEHAGDSPYKFWAESSLGRFGTSAPQEIRQPSRSELLRWNVVGSYGYAYDSNVILQPNDETVTDDRQEHAGRQELDLGMRYRAVSRRDLAVDLLYATRQSIHDQSFDEFNFHSEEFGLNVRKKLQVAGRDVVAGVRYDFLLGFLSDDLFSARNRWHLSAETRLTPQTRTVIYDRITQSQFGPDGVEPAKTSRDGASNDIGVTQYWYTRDFSRYLYAREEFNANAARGRNFDLVGSTSRVGFFTPLVKKLDLETSAGLLLGFYPNHTSISTRDTSRRRDLTWDIYTALTYHLTPRLGIRAFYRYIGAENQNNLFDYDRQIGGAHLIYDIYF